MLVVALAPGAATVVRTRGSRRPRAVFPRSRRRRVAGGAAGAVVALGRRQRLAPRRSRTRHRRGRARGRGAEILASRDAHGRCLVRRCRGCGRARTGFRRHARAARMAALRLAGRPRLRRTNRRRRPNLGRRRCTSPGRRSARSPSPRSRFSLARASSAPGRASPSVAGPSWPSPAPWCCSRRTSSCSPARQPFETRASPRPRSRFAY